MNIDVQCGATPEWRCFAVGVRNHEGRDNVLESESWYQPLPSDIYDVDVQVAVNFEPSDPTVTTPMHNPCGAIFIQHVTGQSNVIGPYKPILDFDWSFQPSNTISPPSLSVIGAISQQRQSYAQYLASMQEHCSSTSEVRVKHDDGGVRYSAVYIPIPGGGSKGSVDQVNTLFNNHNSFFIVEIQPRRHIKRGIPDGIP